MTKPKKLSSYQKLKKENASLRNDIYNLIKKENEFIGLETRARYKMKFDIEDSIAFGDRSTILRTGGCAGVNLIT